MDGKVISNVSDLTPIADALRAATGGTQTYSVSELSVAAANAISSGGGSSVAIDTTLTQSGQAADAQAVGEALETKADVGHTHTAAEIGADVSGAAYSALTSAKSYTDTQIAAIDYPVDSVNGKTGAVVLSASDVGALPSTTVIPDALADLTTDSTHRTVTDAEKATWNAKSDFSGSYNDLTNKPTIPSISGLASETYVNNAVSGKANTSDLTSHTGNKSNPHGVTLSQLGVNATATELNYVDGVTSSIQTQLNSKVPNTLKVNGKALSADITLSASDVGAATESYVNTAVANLVDSSPDTLNTLNELAAALGDDPNFATTMATELGKKVDKVSGKGLSTNDYTTTEKNKLAGIATGATKITVDSALSSTSTNPVQNKVVNAAISNLQTQINDIEVTIPVKGVHYFTPADQEAIVQQVLNALGTPVYGQVASDKTIVLEADLGE